MTTSVRFSHVFFTQKYPCILSKKKFKKGLERVFSPEPATVESGEGTAFLEKPFIPNSGDSAHSDKSRSKSSSRKNFTTDLDSLLKEALQESFEEQMELRQNESAGKVKAFHKKASTQRPMTGLDQLIRRTIESSDMQVAEEKPGSGKKRLVVTFEKEKVDKLKKIARLEKAYLKEILNDLVANFIKEYESKKGPLSS